MTLTKGEHTIRFWGMDQNLVLQKFVIMSAEENLKPSLIGPEPTYNTSMGEVEQKQAVKLIVND